jgi:hypothetical protein
MCTTAAVPTLPTRIIPLTTVSLLFRSHMHAVTWTGRGRISRHGPKPRTRWTRSLRGRLPAWLVVVTFYKLQTWELSASMVLGLQGALSFSFLFLFLYSVPFWRNYQYSWNNHALDGLYRLH